MQNSNSYSIGCSLIISEKLVNFFLILISIRFKKVPNKERLGVKFFVSDMSNTFKSVKNRFFKNSIHIVIGIISLDKFHGL